MNLGALNVENTSGIFYTAAPRVLDQFNKDSYAIRKIKQKQLYGEGDHPAKTKEMLDDIRLRNDHSKDIARQYVIDFKELAMHIKSFKLTEVDVKDPITGLNKILITGLIKPFGKYKQQLTESLQNPNINTAFSIRTIMIEEIIHGRTNRTIVALITWDAVLSPGIPGSTDHGAMGFEADEVSVEQIDKLINEYTNTENGQETANDLCEIRQLIVDESLNAKKTRKSLLTDWN